MAVLTIIRDGKSQEFTFTPPMLLDQALDQAGFSIPRPCGGRGVCGKCAVELSGSVSEPNEAER
jgi:ferredoxin